MGFSSSHFRGVVGVLILFVCLLNLSHHPSAFTTFSKFHGLNTYYEKNYLYFISNLHIMNFTDALYSPYLWNPWFYKSLKPFSASNPIKTFPRLRGLVWFAAGAKQATWRCWSLSLLLPPLSHCILPGWEVQNYRQYCSSEKHSGDLQNDTRMI